ncbi:MAG: prolyl oligopeptidase family serine peptidase [Myxacorys chilensis ATA2-1-KO14]|jgi:polyhydroxybutyrate depolymerase|nr:prolyl oligopeptidase family serine peptidase [Myxacorys chilensis ATA2-1-KO14]
MAKATHWHSWQRAIVQNVKGQNSKEASIKLLATVGIVANLAACQPSFHHSTTGEQAATAAQPSFKPDEFGTLQDQGRQRTYYLHTPPNYQSARPIPLVLAFHGSGQQGKPLADLTGLNQLADQQGFIVAYPDGIEKKWNVSGKATTGEDNVAFVDALLAHLKQIRAIDTRRIYVTGISNGGILVQKLACQRPQEIAAFATVAASLPHQFTPTCQTKTPISLIMINGTADAVVPWNGGSPPKVQVGRQLSIPPIPAVINFWQQRDGCTSPATTQTSQNDRVEISRYANCRAGSEVVLVALKGAGHVWTKGGQSAFPDSGQMVWNFFQRHSL